MSRSKITRAVALAVALGGLLRSVPSLAASAGGNTIQPTPASVNVQSANVQSVQDELLQMASKAGVIFAGQVLRVTPQPSFTAGSDVVEIEFRIDQPVRGCAGQSTYTLREWAGLWTGGHQRYTPGQRVLILLHAASASGLSSPVGGQDGVIPIVGGGAAPGPNDTFVAQADPTVDLRWVQARLPRGQAPAQSTRAHSFNEPAPVYVGREQALLATRKDSPRGVLRSTSGEANAVESTSTLPLASSTPGISLRGILAILGAWQSRQNDASR